MKEIFDNYVETSFDGLEQAEFKFNQFEFNYKKFFPDLKIMALHGQLKPEEKQETLELFNDGKIDILISTSVQSVFSQ
jgi:ATP-dependent DNA helicase RecG